MRASLAEGTLGGARATSSRGAGAAEMRVAEARVRRMADFMIASLCYCAEEVTGEELSAELICRAAETEVENL